MNGHYTHTHTLGFCGDPFICTQEIAKLTESDRRAVTLEDADQAVARRNFLRVGSVLCLGRVGQIFTCAKCPGAAHLTRVNFTVCSTTIKRLKQKFH